MVCVPNGTVGSGCVERDVLLNKGPSSNVNNNRSHSLVEACGSQERWESACDTEWTREDAATICRQAGFHQLGGYDFMQMTTL